MTWLTALTRSRLARIVILLAVVATLMPWLLDSLQGNHRIYIRGQVLTDARIPVEGAVVTATLTAMDRFHIPAIFGPTGHIYTKLRLVTDVHGCFTVSGRGFNIGMSPPKKAGFHVIGVDPSWAMFGEFAYTSGSSTPPPKPPESIVFTMTWDEP